MQNQFAISCAIVAGLWSSSADAQSKCLSSNDASSSLINGLKRRMMTADPSDIADRDTLYHIPVVSADQISQVVLVSDEKTCDKALVAIIALGNFGTPTRAYVVKLGTKGYAVWAPSTVEGAGQDVLVFDTKFVKIGGYGGV